jgi:hypothetical protein
MLWYGLWSIIRNILDEEDLFSTLTTSPWNLSVPFTRQQIKKGSEMSVDFLSRSFVEVGARFAPDMNWAHEQEKDNLSNLIRESLDKKWIYKFPMPDWYKKAPRKYGSG